MESKSFLIGKVVRNASGMPLGDAKQVVSCDRSSAGSRLVERDALILARLDIGVF